MPYGITQCYRAPGIGENSTFIPAEAGTRYSEATPEGCKAELTCYIKAYRLGIELATCQSQVQRPTSAPPRNTPPPGVLNEFSRVLARRLSGMYHLWTYIWENSDISRNKCASVWNVIRHSELNVAMRFFVLFRHSMQVPSTHFDHRQFKTPNRLPSVNGDWSEHRTRRVMFPWTAIYPPSSWTSRSLATVLGSSSWFIDGDTTKNSKSETRWKLLWESTNPRESVFVANTRQHLPHLLSCGPLVSNFPTELFCEQSPVFVNNRRFTECFDRYFHIPSTDRNETRTWSSLSP